jgi:hypothetical protein
MSLRQPLESLALATGQLTAKQVRLIGDALAEVARMDLRQATLQTARAALDPDGNLSTWQVAIRLESALQRFQGAPLKRVKAGHRRPTALECALLVLLDCGGPQCHEKLYAELKSLTAPSQ